MRVVLDTNIVVSALKFPGNERFVLELALRGRFEFYLSRIVPHLHCVRGVALSQLRTPLFRSPLEIFPWRAKAYR